MGASTPHIRGVRSEAKKKNKEKIEAEKTNKEQEKKKRQKKKYKEIAEAFEDVGREKGTRR
jgi:hypothetical protein